MLIYVYHQMCFGMVVVLWPYEWKVMGSNLVGHKEGFIFANSSLEWSWKSKGKKIREGGVAKGLKNLS